MSPLPIRQFSLRTLLTYFIIIAIALSLLLYIVYQARFFLAGPTLAIYTENTVSTERTVVFEGEAANITHIELNGRTIYTDERGYFKETVVLENGYTIATVRATDRYGRTTSVSRSFVYAPEMLESNS